MSLLPNTQNIQKKYFYFFWIFCVLAYLFRPLIFKDIREKLCSFKGVVLREFGLSPLSDVRWEKKRDTFISAVSKIAEADNQQ